jgi:hypothetical protein
MTPIVDRYNYLKGPVPFYHGTTSIYLDSIRTHGLGGRSLATEWGGLEAFQIAYEWAKSNRTIGSDLDFMWSCISREKDDWKYASTHISSSIFKACGYSTVPGGELIHQFSKLISEYNISAEDVPGLREPLRRLTEQLRTLEDGVVEHEPIVLVIRKLNYEEVDGVPSSWLGLKSGPHPMDILGMDQALTLKKSIPFDRLQVLNIEQQRLEKIRAQEIIDRGDYFFDLED